MEIWKDILGYEGKYQVSDKGNVRSLNYHRKGIIKNLKQGKDTCGYLQVILSLNNFGKTYKVHRLVWEAFNGKIPEGYEINHLSEIKTENNLSNLSLVTHAQNMSWGTRNERSANSNRNNVKRSKPVVQYDLNGNFVKEWPSIMEIQRQLGYSQSSISYCCSGRYKRVHDYIFKYK